MLPFAPGIVGYCTEQNDRLSLELRSLRQPRTVIFTTQDQTAINTIKGEFSPILEDYLGDSIPGFSDAFMEMQSHPIPVDGEEREFEIFSGVKMKFCWIPAGEAQLGRPKEDLDYVDNIYDFLPGWLDDEVETVRGIHKSNGFWLGKYEVTQTQWEGVVGGNPSYLKGANLPVENVTWHGCRYFANKCSALGLKLQIPHEDQWEYACRGGKGNKQPFYWGNTLNGEKANCNGNVPYGTDEKGVCLARTTEVGSYEKIAPHPWGLCDMHGNVREWCENSYKGGGSRRVVRGGSWMCASRVCRSSYRSIFDQGCCNGSLGFRLIIC